MSHQTYYYRLAVNWNGSKIFSETFQYKTSNFNVDNFFNNAKILIYLNPVIDFIIVKPNNSNEIKYKWRESIFSTSDNIKIDATNFEKGFKLLRINFENNKNKTNSE